MVSTVLCVKALVVPQSDTGQCRNRENTLNSPIKRARVYVWCRPGWSCGVSGMCILIKLSFQYHPVVALLRGPSQFGLATSRARAVN